jgi:hypothetical protein
MQERQRSPLWEVRNAKRKTRVSVRVYLLRPTRPQDS